ncbi:hypothetical protein Poli38472_009058 [Pythium oligandrum]|uniref:Striatin N-terminal domain-containing protein n=1 Tax=Pythium oligandrum TaxID=41045 RepID=A0A8K1FJG3_PYTOL|nr:hypothetical protein Poli38472_009058 [Pythium oligandrum]|eukprot:TMW64891.1 hypothetical protein Poli38472_009058 [Pythium oligandrum]
MQMEDAHGYERLVKRVEELEERCRGQEAAHKALVLKVQQLEQLLQEKQPKLAEPAPVVTVEDSTKSLRGGLKKSSVVEGSSRTVTMRPPERVVTFHPSLPSPAESPKAQTRASCSGSGSFKALGSPRASTAPRFDAQARQSSGHRLSIGDSFHSQSQKNVKPQPLGLVTKAPFRPLKLKWKLLGHMDGVRSLSYHPTEPMMVTGGEDCTVRVWKIVDTTHGLASQRPSELDSILTLRAHTASVLAVSLVGLSHSSSSNNRGLLASSGRDGTICLHKLPQLERDTAEPRTFEEHHSFLSSRVERAHDDAVWDLHAHPRSPILFSAGADGVVKIWESGPEGLTAKSELRSVATHHRHASGHSYHDNLVPTSVTSVPSDAKSCAVGYTNGGLALFDVANGQLTQMVRPKDAESNGRDHQVNRVVAHPTMPLVVSGHLDRKIRMFDLRSGECIATIAAHLSAVSSVSFDSSGQYVASGGHDGSMRVWAIAERQCVFEQSVHRPKWAEAINSVSFHPTQTSVATAGADGLVKVFQ